MTKKELEALVTKLQAEAKSSMIRKLWDWCKPSLIPFILGMLVGGTAAGFRLPALEQQAATGGAVIPFPSVSPSPSLSALPLIDSMQEPSDCTSMSTSEESSPSSPQADAGQTTSIRFYRTPRRLIR